MVLLGSAFPVGDVQFWVVTAIGLAALAFLLRGLVPKRWKPRGRAGEKKATLTVEGKAVDRP